MATIAPLLLSTTTRILSRTTTTLAPIQIVTIRLNYYASIIILIIGFFGCLCNFITFTAPQLRSNSCAFYFLIAAIFELFSISFGLISRLATENLGSNLVHTNQAFCKLRAYLVSAIPLVATYLVLLASIDRCLSSSVNARLRSFSRMKVAYRAMLVAAVIAFSSCSHILVSYDLRPRCSTKPGDYAKFDGLFVVFWLGVIPHGLMLLFGSLTFWNVRQNKRRVNAQTTSASVGIQSNQIREQKRQRQLMIMMLVQVGVSSLLIMTRMIYYAYSILGPSLTGYNRLIANFLSTFTIMLYYINYAKSFYIYTLSSQLFRSIFIHRVKSAVRKILGANTPALFQERVATLAGAGTSRLHTTRQK